LQPTFAAAELQTLKKALRVRLTFGIVACFSYYYIASRSFDSASSNLQETRVPSAKMTGGGEHSILNEMLAHSLQRLEVESGGYEAVAAKAGIAKGTLYAISHGKGNPTFRTLERMARSLDLSVFELLGLRNEDARRALARFGVDYDELEAAVASKNKADLFLARSSKTRK
jgi:DNA-binding phage protein